VSEFDGLPDDMTLGEARKLLREGGDLSEVRQNRLGRWHSGSAATARKAALDNFPTSGKQRHRVLLAVHAAGARGATSDEISAAHRIRLYSVKPRLIELREGGWVEAAGERPSETGSMVQVFVATDKARRAFDELAAKGQETVDTLSKGRLF